MENKMRVGIGYDAHPLIIGRKLILGGIEIPFVKGLDGWSDSDVLVHAIIDALLGAATLGNIGTHFPPGQPEYRDISSLKLLEITLQLLREKGWRVVNIDTTVILSEPKLKDYIEPMREKLSQTLAISIENISIKASTSNGLGFAGSGEGISAFAVTLIENSSN